MSQRNSSASRIHILHAQIEDLGVRLDHGSKSFVEFPHGNIRLRQTRLLEELLDHGSGSNREVNWI